MEILNIGLKLLTLASTDNQGTNNFMPIIPNNFMPIILMVALFGVMYFVMIRPQKKRQKEEQERRDAVQIGDEITTIGGIIGRVVTVKEDSLVIETGADRTKMKITRWALQTNNTADERLQAERAAQAEARQKEREEKMASKRSKKKGSDENKGDAASDNKE